MKSVLLRAPPGATAARAQVVEVPVPSIGREELLIEMKACGLCGTDIEKMFGQYTASLPVLGHEAVGVVAGIGGAVKGFKMGDRVFPHHHVPCLNCYYCRHGSETMCQEYRKTNLDPGGFSEFFRVPAWNTSHGGVLKLPDNVSFEEASLTEPVACCIRALDRCGVRADDSVLVVGAGPVGMAHALILVSRKAKVMVSDVSQGRLKFAEAAGVGLVIDANKRDVGEAVRKETSGRGADLAIVASGSKAAIIQALRSVRRGGKVCLFGVPEKGTVLDYDMSDLLNSEVSVVSSNAATEKETTMALGMISLRGVKLASLITHRFRIEEFEKGVEAVTRGTGMKVVITP